jgi:hypothetical protein
VAKLSEENFRAGVQPHLQPGEQLVHVAYGVKQPNFFVIVLLIATIGGSLAVGLLTKHYLLALTDRRLLIVQVQGGLFGVSFATKAVTEYSFAQLASLPIKTSTGGLFTHVRIDAPQRFVAKFHRMATKTNRHHAMGIAQALEAMRSGAAPQLAQGQGAPYLPPAPGAYGAPPFGQGQPGAAMPGQGFPGGGQQGGWQPQAANGAPPQAYGAPPQAYGAAPNGMAPAYGAPPQAYGAPPQAYGAPQANGGPQPYGAMPQQGPQGATPWGQS